MNLFEVIFFVPFDAVGLKAFHDLSREMAGEDKK